jgi:uncharacterized protein (DUF433 family)
LQQKDKNMTDWRLHIGTEPKIMFGKPVILNTRIPVDLVLEKLAGGDTFDDLLEAYPKISKEDIIACILFAADSVKKEIILPTAS